MTYIEPYVVPLPNILQPLEIDASHPDHAIVSKLDRILEPSEETIAFV